MSASNKRSSVLAELITSEREHIQDLQLAESIYLLPLKAKLSSQTLLHAVRYCVFKRELGFVENNFFFLQLESVDDPQLQQRSVGRTAEAGRTRP